MILTEIRKKPALHGAAASIFFITADRAGNGAKNCCLNVKCPSLQADAGIDLEVFKQIWQIKHSQLSQLCQQHEAETKVYVVLHYINKTIQ